MSQSYRSMRALAVAVALSSGLAFASPAATAQDAAGSVATQQSAAPSPVQPSTERAAPGPEAAAPSLRSVAVGLRELSPWSMFLSATFVVQAIMVGLAFASLVTWTIAFAKALELFIAKRRLNAALAAVASVRTLREASARLSSDRTVMRDLVGFALSEMRLSNEYTSDGGVKERVASSVSDIARTEARRIRLGMGVLATIAATAPFVGLFGTVWGIMNSFIGISKTQTTNLAVVAPGIAEALLATALGLFAAIPAVMIYNHFSRLTKGYLELVGRAGGAVTRQLSRDLERPHPALRAAAE